MLKNFDPQTFLTKHWQKSPCLIKQAFSTAPQLITADELAGLALEDEVESRIIQNTNNHWQLLHGPFDEATFQQLPEKNWTLLIQTADYWIADSSHFLEYFRFIPRWRFDDLMISYATEGGGVGPHFDHYDVFLVQAEGKRHWRVGEMGDTNAKQTVIDSLLHLESFTPIIDVVMQPGDILYIPPNTPHWGVSCGHSIGYSVGYRAPQTKDIFAMLANHLESAKQNQFFSDKYRKKPNQSSQLEPELIQWAQNEIKKISENQELITSLLSASISQAKIMYDHFEDNSTSFDPTKINRLQLKPELNYNWYQNHQQITLSIEGESFQFSLSSKSLIKKIASGKAVDIKGLNANETQFAFCKTLTRIINRGYFLIDS